MQSVLCAQRPVTLIDHECSPAEQTAALRPGIHNECQLLDVCVLADRGDGSTGVTHHPPRGAWKVDHVAVAINHRDAIVPYDRKVVQQFLQDVEPTELRSIKKALNRKWRTVRKEYIQAIRRPADGGDNKPLGR